MAYPYGVWMVVFIIAPILLVVFYAFTNKSGALTLGNFTSMMEYMSIFGRSFLLAFAATVVCLLLGYPLAYIMSRQPPRWQSFYMMLIMLPMWMNFLLRTYAWMSILENNGFINQFLQNVGFIDLLNRILQPETPIRYLPLINTGGAVVLGMVYNFLPFMVLPIYNVLIKIDGKLIEAAQDLGAPSRTVFRRVIFPLSMPGVVSGITMVFVPAVSTFVISKTLGGGKEMLIGDLIDLQFMGNAYNPQLGSAIALVMMVLVFLCMFIMNRFDDGSKEEGGLLL
ncbi:MAG: ABC transporter permease [Clostridiaceae bacterium]|nr:ABC transporter permease [Clostridiaceae bacterium]MCI9484950.1 ABC transporter permease [Clostridiaceae bacterium]NBH79311.1 ABC transporter permease [Clostridiaceae bacterium]NBI81912.1 ABC transporter permease [Clostridiaceae bacterium]